MTLWAADLERRGPVGWITVRRVGDAIEESLRQPEVEYVEVHLATALHLYECRFDREIRVVVLTGAPDDEFYVVPPVEHYEPQDARDRLNPLLGMGGHTRSPRAAPSALETLVLMEKPVIARVNGDSIGYGESLMWGCDFIVAREDAVVADPHLGQGDILDRHGNRVGFPWGITPGDGTLGFIQQFLPPTKLKEFLMLGRSLSVKELAALGAINYAVPADQVDAVVDGIIEELLARPPAALARTKRVANKHVIEQWNLTQDLSWWAELLDFWEHARDGHMDAEEPA